MTSAHRSRFALFALVTALSTLAAAPVLAVEVRSGDVVQSSGELRDMLFAAGRDLSVSARSTDDVFVAGEQVRVGEAVADHLFVAGSSVRIAGAAAKDVFAAAAELTLESGQAQDDVVAAGGTIVVRPAFRIGGSAMLTGGRIDVESALGGDLVAAGGEIRVDSAIGGNAELSGDRIVIGPNARIAGDLIYEADKVEISPQAVVGGKRIARSPKGPQSAQRIVGAAVAAAAAFLLVFALGGALLVLAAVWAFPGLMDKAARRIEAQPLPTTGAGFLLLLAGPIAIGLMMVTVVGLPLALLVLTLYLVSLPLAVAAVVYWAAMRGRRALARGRSLPPAALWPRLGWCLLAMLALLILGSIPGLAALVWLAVYVIGIGAVMIEARRALAHP